MSRIQRARALRLGFILASLLCASVASARPQDVPGSGNDPKLDACWASGPATPEHLGPCLGMTAAEIGAKPVKGMSRAKAARCDAKASLDWQLAVIIGQDMGATITDSTPETSEHAVEAAAVVGAPDPDAVWEDSFAACVAE